MSVQTGNTSDNRELSSDGVRQSGRPLADSSLTAGTVGITARAVNGWILSPAVDLLVLSNVLWPMLLLLQHDRGFDGRSAVLFWQVYFVTTPHRWITLALVFLDRQRFRERPRLFVGFAILVTGLCVGIRINTGSLTCLLAVDYVWNAWHFAAQHHGVYRIYGRLSQPERIVGLSFEKWLMRFFLIYVIIRIATATFADSWFSDWMKIADWLVIAIPLWLVLQDLRSWNRLRTGRTVYLLSVSGLYLSLLWAVHQQRPALVLSLATASALFHAVEYLALTGWAVNRRSVQMSTDKLGIIGWLAPRWALTLIMFIVILGSGGWLMDQNLLELWLLINVIVAFLHYGYDGMIWKGPGRRILSAKTIPAA